jgi:hypothetical protein
MVVRAEGQLESIDVSSIKGNAPDDAKNYVYRVFQHLVGHKPRYNHEIGNRIELKEVNIWGDAGSQSAKAETIFEIEVTPGTLSPSIVVNKSLMLGFDNSWVDMCNIFGIMHGGCAAYLIDQSVSVPSRTSTTA